jgi:hypothetical protein
MYSLNKTILHHVQYICTFVYVCTLSAGSPFSLILSPFSLILSPFSSLGGWGNPTPGRGRSPRRPSMASRRGSSRGDSLPAGRGRPVLGEDRDLPEPCRKRNSRDNPGNRGMDRQQERPQPPWVAHTAVPYPAVPTAAATPRDAATVKKTVEIKVYLNFLACWWKDTDPDSRTGPVQKITDPDDPKTPLF